MSDPRKDPLILRKFAYYEFRQRTQVVKAHSKLNELAIQDGLQPLSYREVEGWYLKFTGGDFDLEDDIRIDTNDRNIMDLPEELQKCIFSNLNCTDFNRLRRVCVLFKEYVDAGEPMYDKIEIEFQRTMILVKINCPKTGLRITRYEENGPNCNFITSEGTETKAASFIEEATLDFYTAVKRKHTKLVKFTILVANNLCTAESDAKRSRFFELMDEKLSSLPSQLCVERLDIYVKNPIELETILQNMKPGMLEELLVLTSYFPDTNDVHDMDQIVVLPQWAHINKLLICLRRTNISLLNVVHMKKVSITDKIITLDEIVKYKTALQNIHSMQKMYHQITCNLSQEDLKNAFNLNETLNDRGTIFGTLTLSNGKFMNVEIRERGFTIRC